MKKDETHFSPKRIEEAAKVHDAITRAKAVSPVTSGRDILKTIDTFGR
jgi:hypothetical protein